MLYEMNVIALEWRDIKSECWRFPLGLWSALTPFFLFESFLFYFIFWDVIVVMLKRQTFLFCGSARHAALCEALSLVECNFSFFWQALFCVNWTTIKMGSCECDRHSSAGAEIFFHTKIENWVKKAPFLEWMNEWSDCFW